MCAHMIHARRRRLSSTNTGCYTKHIHTLQPTQQTQQTRTYLHHQVPRVLHAGPHPAPRLVGDYLQLRAGAAPHDDVVQALEPIFKKRLKAGGYEYIVWWVFIGWAVGFGFDRFDRFCWLVGIDE